MSHHSAYQANTINTEFGADLNGIQTHIDDLHRIAAGLLLNLEDFGGLRKRIYLEWPLESDSGFAAHQAIDKYAADLQDSYYDIDTYTGYTRDLYYSLYSVKAELESILHDAETGDLDVAGYIIYEPEKPGDDSTNSTQTAYQGKKAIYDSLKSRSVTIRTDETTAYTTFRNNCELIFKSDIDLVTGSDGSISIQVMGAVPVPSLLSQAVKVAKPTIPDEPDTFSKLGLSGFEDAADTGGKAVDIASLISELGEIFSEDSKIGELLDSLGKAMGTIDIGTNAAKGVDAFWAGFQEQWEMGAYNPELSPKERLVQSLARGQWEAAPYGAKISIDIVSLTAGEALTPLGAFALSQIGSIVVDLAHKAMDSKVEKDVDAIQWD